MNRVEQTNIEGMPLLSVFFFFIGHLLAKSFEGAIHFPWLSTASGLATIIAALATASPSLRNAIDKKIKKWLKL